MLMTKAARMFDIVHVTRGPKTAQELRDQSDRDDRMFATLGARCRNTVTRQIPIIIKEDDQ